MVRCKLGILRKMKVAKLEFREKDSNLNKLVTVHTIQNYKIKQLQCSFLFYNPWWKQAWKTFICIYIYKSFGTAPSVVSVSGG